MRAERRPLDVKHIAIYTTTSYDHSIPLLVIEVCVRIPSRALLSAMAAVLTGSGVVAVGGVAAYAAVIARPGSDFNGDGYQDLAIAVPNGTVHGKKQAGYVTVVYGSSTGLKPAKGHNISQDWAIVPGSPETGDHFGQSIASGDFNGDGIGDLAVGVPDEDLGSGTDAGWVTVLFGSKKGFTSVVSFGEPSIPNPQYGASGFGRRVIAGNVDGGKNNELVVAWNGWPTGWLFCWPSTAKTTPKGVLTEETNTADSTTLGDVTGDGYADLITVDMPGGQPTVLRVRPGGPGGFGPPKELGLGKDDVISLAVGDLNRDGRSDIVLGEPLAAKGGAVRVIYGDSGTTFGRSQLLYQQDPNMPGPNRADGSFADNLAVGDVNGDGYPDVAVGMAAAGWVPKGRSYQGGLGAVIVLRGSASGLTTKGGQAFTENSTGIPGTPVSGHYFGRNVTLIDHNRDGRAELTVSIIGGGGYAWDNVVVLRGGTAGLTGSGVKRMDAYTFGIPRKDGAGFGDILLR